MDPHFIHTHMLRFWAGTPDQHRQTDRLYRRMGIGAAQCELFRNNGERFLAPGYACVPRAEWLRRTIRCSRREPTLGTRATMGCDGLEEFARVRRRMEYTWSDFWTTPGRPSSLFPRRAIRPQSHPTLGVEIFGSNVADWLSSSREELPVSIDISTSIMVLVLVHTSVGRPRD